MMTQSLVLAKRPHVVIATPGRCADHLQSTDTFSLHKIKYLVLDEADRLLEDTFAADLEVIFSHVAEKRQTLLFSATLNDTIEELRGITATNPFCYSVQDKYVSKILHSHLAVSPVNPLPCAVPKLGLTVHENSPYLSVKEAQPLKKPCIICDPKFTHLDIFDSI